MPRLAFLRLLLALPAMPLVATAQDVAAALAAVDQHIHTQQWQAAVDDLIAQAALATSDDARLQFADRFFTAGNGLMDAGVFTTALRAHEGALRLRRSVRGKGDDLAVAASLGRVATCTLALDDPAAASQGLTESVAMYRRLLGDADDANLAEALNNLATCLLTLGRPFEALPHLQAAVAMVQRLHRGADHLSVATYLNNLGSCLWGTGRTAEAVRVHKAALAMRQRLLGNSDHVDVATSLTNLGVALLDLGRADEALPRFELALAMRRRLADGRAQADLVSSLANLASCLRSLGRADAALPLFTEALVMGSKVPPEQLGKELVLAYNGTALCMDALGHTKEGLTALETALTAAGFLWGNSDQPIVTMLLGNLGTFCQKLGQPTEALRHIERAIAMDRRLHGDGDSRDLAIQTTNLAACLLLAGRSNDAMTQAELALAMQQRCYGDRDHADLAVSLGIAGACCEALGRGDEARTDLERACAMIERLREGTRVSPTTQQALFDHLKSFSSFERLQRIATRQGRTASAFQAAEASRARELLDRIGQAAFDPFVEAIRRATRTGDEATAARLPALRSEIEAADVEVDRLLALLTRLGDAAGSEAARQTRRQELFLRSDAANAHRRQLLDERARLLGDVLPVGRTRTAGEIQSALREGELLLEFTVTQDVNLLYVLARDGDVVVVPIPQACSTLERLLPALLQRCSHGQIGTRGRDPEDDKATDGDATASTELLASLIPADTWKRVQAARRVFVAAHRQLHRVPFELLVTDVVDGKPVHWLENGPPISYVPSGSTLHWLRQRAKDASDDTTALDLLVVGDPGALAVEPEVPEQGVFVATVSDGGEGARVGLQPRDVLLSYDGQALVDDKTLADARTATEAAIENGQRADTPIEIEIWRRGEKLKLAVPRGKLGIGLGPGKARVFAEMLLNSEARLERITRSGDLERLRQLPPLRGARLETEAIEGVFAAQQRKTEHLLGSDATEPAVFALAPRAKYLHFACHGIAEEYAGQSLSMLVLSQPQHVLPGDDGLLKLSDLLQNWPGRLSSTQLVVLSACRTNVGSTLRDEAPYALPVGFLFAGVPSVIASLWAVDDASTRELMTDFYSRLLAGETDKLKAFTDAKKALRQKYPDPFHWAPFLYMGAPD